MHLDWTDIKLLAAVISGLVLSMMLSTASTWKARAICITAGMICAYFGTEPVVHMAGQTYNAGGWPYVIAGILAMTGDRLVRRIMGMIDTLQIPPFLGGEK